VTASPWIWADRIKGGAEKTGPPSHCKYSEIPRPNCVEIGELLQYYMMNTVINFLFKNFIALWRHLAKTQLLSFIHIVQIDLSITTGISHSSCVFAYNIAEVHQFPRNSVMEFSEYLQ